MSKVNDNPKEWGRIFEIGDKKYYPSAPSEEELKIIEEHFNKIIKKRARVLVLGATPGLRDIAIKHNCELTSVDINMDSFFSMNKLMDYKSDKEIIIKGNWLTVPLPNKYFDVILGDHVFNNVSYEEHDALFKKLRTLLKPEGYLIIRNVVIALSIKTIDTKKIVNDFRLGKIKWLDLKYLIRYFNSDSWTKWYNPKTRESYWKMYFDYIKELYEKGIMNKQEFDSINREACDLVSIMLTKNEFESIIKKYFKIAKIIFCNAYQCCKATPIYILKRI